MSKIEQDDLKMDRLLELQSMTETPPTPLSIEKKYEEELFFQQMASSIIKQLEDGSMEDEDGEEIFEEEIC